MSAEVYVADLWDAENGIFRCQAQGRLPITFGCPLSRSHTPLQSEGKCTKEHFAALLLYAPISLIPGEFHVLFASMVNRNPTRVRHPFLGELSRKPGGGLAILLQGQASLRARIPVRCVPWGA